MLESTRIVTGTANPQLATDVAEFLHMDLLNAEVGRFSDGEISVEIHKHIRGETCFVIQSTCAPVNDNLVELLVIIDALKRADVSRIVAVIPYYGYARQDRRPGFRRTPITAKLVASMIERAGADMVVTVDIHSEQQQGFFDVNLVNISASPIIVTDIWKHYSDEDLTIVSPDIGGTGRARSIAQQLDNRTVDHAPHVELAIIDKRRPRANVSEIMHIVGDVQDKTCVIIDDMADTAGTLCKGAAALRMNGAKSVVAYCTHPVLSGNAIDNIFNSELDELIVTDTIPLPDTATYGSNRDNGEVPIRIITVANILGETISRLRHFNSVSAMYF